MTPKSRSNLRNFRTHAGIDAQAHLLTVEKEVCATVGGVSCFGLRVGTIKQMPQQLRKRSVRVGVA